MEKKLRILKSALYALGVHAVLNFLWTAFLTTGTKMAAEASEKAGKTVETILSAEGVGQVLDRLLSSQIYIALFSAVFGFSFLIFGLKNMSNPAKYSLHIILNYVAALLCSYMLFSSGSENGAATGFVAVLFLVSMAFFALYGIVSLISFFVRKKTR